MHHLGSLYFGPTLNQLIFLVINCVGAEFDILRTIPWSKVDIRIMTIEVAHMDLDKRSELIDFLEAKGYETVTDLGSLDILFAKID